MCIRLTEMLVRHLVHNGNNSYCGYYCFEDNVNVIYIHTRLFDRLILLNIDVMVHVFARS